MLKTSCREESGVVGVVGESGRGYERERGRQNKWGEGKGRGLEARGV